MPRLQRRLAIHPQAQAISPQVHYLGQGHTLQAAGIPAAPAANPCLHIREQASTLHQEQASTPRQGPVFILLRGLAFTLRQGPGLILLQELAFIPLRE